MSVHPTAEVSPDAEIGAGTRVWHQAQVRERARLGADCMVGKGAYIDAGVQIGDKVRIQNGAFVYHGCTLEDGVFIGPRACLTNDKRPRAINPDGSAKGPDDWEVGRIVVRQGASIGAGAIVVPDATIGRFAMVAAGAVVTKDVPAHGLVVGVPARLIGFVCVCAEKLSGLAPVPDVACRRCGRRYRIDGGPDGSVCRAL
jgi:UDP-2-acetamido-3-amino-2,3-dideoxy-glucuronate N-acetyltransferase